MSPNIKISKILTIGLASYGLTACGLSSIVSDGIDINGNLVGTPKATTSHAYIEQNFKSGQEQYKEIEVEHSVTSDNTHTIKRGVNLYTIGTRNIVYDGNGGEKWSRNTSAQFGSQVGKTLEIENKSDQLLNDKLSYKTKDVELWYITNSRFKVSSNGQKDFLTFEAGFADFGQKSQDIPKAGVVLYTGGYVAREVERKDSSYREFLGKATFATDFNIGEPKISGVIDDISRITTLAGQETRPTMVIYDGVIANGGFNAKIKLGDSKLADQISGTVKGSFYGENAKEIAGTGQFSTNKRLTVFGFTGN